EPHPGQDPGGDQGELELPVAVQQDRGNQGHEGPAQRAAGRDMEVERRQPARGRAASRQLAVYGHAATEERGRVDDDLLGEVRGALVERSEERRGGKEWR